jgi:hypothetical protein
VTNFHRTKNYQKIDEALSLDEPPKKLVFEISNNQIFSGAMFLPQVNALLGEGVVCLKPNVF